AGPPDAGPPEDGGVPTELPVLQRPVRGSHFGHVSVAPSAPATAPSTGRPKFHWTLSPGAESFHLQVSRDVDFATLDLDIDDIFANYWIAEAGSAEVLGEPGKYFWRVTACNAAGCAPFDGFSYFWLGRVREEPEGEFDGIGAVIVGAPGSGTNGAGTVAIRRGEVLSFVYSTTMSAFLPPRIGMADAPGDDETELGASLVAANFTGSPVRHHLAAGGPLIGGETGLVRIFAGDDPSMFLDLHGTTSPHRYGQALGAADFDGDGHDDLAVGEPGDGTSPGHVYVYWGSGTGLSSLRKIALASPVTGDQYGHALAAVGDVNGDGYSDLAVGAARTVRREGPAGRVYIYYGGPDAMMPTVMSATRTEVDSPLPEADEEFGAAIAGVGDVNHDGFDDVLIGAPGHSTTRGAGSAYLFFGGPTGLGSGPGGALVIPHPGDPAPADARFGEVLSGGGDADGNGYADFVIAAPADGDGRVFVYQMPGTDPVTIPRPVELSPTISDPGMRYGACLALTVDRS
ncbi:MAG: FG-GAP repeat protein, partial [Myxococcales bacterium]|nr:FG-GAP repeat protein [Myxococcales bacterium]